MPAHIPPGREHLWRRQEEADADVARSEAAFDAANKRAGDLVAEFDEDDPIVQDAYEEAEAAELAADRARAVADRIHQERTAGLSWAIDDSPHDPVCPTCKGTGRRPGSDGRDVSGACPGCRGWGREHREPIPVWSEQDQVWVNPATGRTVDLLADDPALTEAQVLAAERHADSLARRGATAEEIDAADAETERPDDARRAALAADDLPTGAKPYMPDLDAVRSSVHYRDEDSEGHPFDDDEVSGADQEDDSARVADDLPVAAKPYVPPKRTQAPTPTRPVAAPTTSSGGSGMASIEEARIGIMAAHRSGEQGLAGLAQVHADLTDAQNGLRNSTEGSNQAEAETANALLAEALNKIDEAQQQVALALQEFEQVGARL